MMFPFPVKRKRKEAADPTEPVAPPIVFPDICIFLVERRMGTARRGFLTSLAQRKGFGVAHEYSSAGGKNCSSMLKSVQGKPVVSPDLSDLEDTLTILEHLFLQPCAVPVSFPDSWVLPFSLSTGGEVTHVVSEQNSFPDVLSWIERKTGKPMQIAEDQELPLILDISWFTESMSSGKPVPVEARHHLGSLGSQVSKDKDALSTVAPYACQRRTPSAHHNSEITDALEILGKSAAFQGSEIRSLGFARAASVLKSLPFKLRSAEEAKNLVWCGGHCQAVIQEILEDGACHEVEVLKINEQYQCMELLTSIFGVGVRTAERWYKGGVRKLSDLDPNVKLTAEQRAGIEHYADLKQPVTREEADRVEHLIKDALHRFVPDLNITMTGGFRRGKQQGHDVDFLITHPTEEALSGVLKKAVDWMESQGLLLYHHTKVRSHGRTHRRSTRMDGHETCYAIFALPNFDSLKSEAGVSGVTHSDLASCGARTWRAVRVDLVVTPYDEYPFALLGWTGSKHFERELRRFSWHEKSLSLNSHGLYNTEQECSIPATSEEEIFALLGLQYVPPPYRNA